MRLKRVLIAMVATLVSFASVSPQVSALDYTSRLGNDISYYDERGQQCLPGSGGSSALNGNDNLQKIYNYFLGKGLKDFQAAGIVGNISVESGGNPKISQASQKDVDDPRDLGGNVAGGLNNTAVGVGNAWGIVQWDHGARALYYQKKSGVQGTIGDLSTQLDIVWWQAQNESPTNFQNSLARMQATTTVEEAVTTWESTFEGAGVPALGARLVAAKLALDYQKNPSATSTSTSPCSSGSGSADASAIVRVAKEELEKKVHEYDTNTLKYTDGRQEAWCADFVSWVYKQAGSPFTGGIGAGGWQYPSVEKLQGWIMKNGHYFAVGDGTPQPGDIAFYIGGKTADGSSSQHVNIVTEVKGNKMTVIGGNQSDSVSTYTIPIQPGVQSLVGFGRLK